MADTRILIWYDKHGEVLYSMDDEGWAYLECFSDMDQADYWFNLEEHEYLYNAAKFERSHEAARTLLSLFGGSEYQRTDVLYMKVKP